MLRLSTFVMITAITLGCASRQAALPSGNDLRVHPTTPSPGDSLTLVLENKSAEAIGYNLCASALERRSGDTWQALPSDRVCTMELRTLSSGQQAQFAFEPPADITAGEYRAITGIERLADQERLGVASDRFRVDR